MGKKRRVLTLTGSMYKFPFRYLQKAELRVSPRDAMGTGMCEEFYKRFRVTPTRMFQQGFEYKLIRDRKMSYSTFHIKFVTGWEHTYVLRDLTMKSLMKNLSYYNYVIEGIRNEANFDDEPEDEELFRFKYQVENTKPEDPVIDLCDIYASCLPLMIPILGIQSFVWR
eukprot:TRINITY_DN3433_c0_g1_i4.p2 TRINITY_DN3433_c0_g1~~TRINITY_DN3433_c0_g1_i4.p2  ORF type:complete len:168 (-),score=18.43 TRINITY_DN3433_c0_g1_i4:197-700(-)